MTATRLLTRDLPVLAAFTIGLALLPAPAAAQTDFTWDGTSDDFSDPNRWTPNGGPPNNIDRALFTVGSTFTVTGPGSPLQAVVDVQDVTFDGALSPVGSLASSTPAFIVGHSAAGSATFSTASSLMASGGVQVGVNSIGTLTFSGGGTGTSQGAIGASATTLGVNNSGDGTLVVNGAGSIFSTTGSLDLAAGANSTATVELEDSGHLDTNGSIALQSAGLNVAVGSSSTATINISGGATLHNELQTNLGLSGRGVMNISSGMFTTSDAGTANPALSIGRLAGSDGELNVSGTGNVLTEGEIIVGGDGTGFMSITDQGQVQANVTVGAPAIVGFGGTSSGTVNVTGSDADWRVTDALIVSETGSGMVELREGGTLFIEDTAMGGDPFLFIGERQSSFGVVSVADENSFLDASFIPVTIGVDQGSSGSLELTEQGEAFIQRTVVGSEGFGTLTAELESVLTTGTVILGEKSTGDGSVDLSEQASMEVIGQLIIADEGFGALDMFEASLTVLEFIVIGDEAGSMGSMFIDSSTVGPSGGSGTLTSLTVGNQGEGELNVSTDSTIDINGSVDFAVGADSTATVDFFAGTALTAVGTLTVGDEGDATWSSFGAAIESGTAFIAKTGGTSSATISGGTWTINNAGPDSGSLFVGGSDTAAGGVGELNVGGTVNVNNRLKVWDAGKAVLTLGSINAAQVEVLGRLEGTGGVTAATTEITGAVAPSRFSQPTGKITFTGDYTQLAGSTLEVQIGGLTAESEFDVIEITGATALAGGLLGVSLIDLGGGLFAPALGNEFTILTTGSFDATDGQYDPGDITLPSLTAGLGWDVIYSATELKLLVVADNAILPGDYDNNGVVDAQDYARWRENLGAPADTLPNDTAGGAIGAAQYNLWRENFGATAPGQASATPEPAIAWLAIQLLMTITCVAGDRHRR